MIYNIKITNDEKSKYLESAIDKVFAILGIYEDCMEQNNFENYFIYLNRLLTEFNGVYYLLDINSFISLVSIIKGMIETKTTNHKSVKSLTFHCISILKKAKVI